MKMKMPFKLKKKQDKGKAAVQGFAINRETLKHLTLRVNYMSQSGRNTGRVSFKLLAMTIFSIIYGCSRSSNRGAAVNKEI